MANVNEVFAALAQGHARYKDILDQSHVSSGPAMVGVLNRLVGMELPRRQTPINDRENGRKTSYRVVDPLSRFYYRHLFRYSSQRMVLNADTFYERFVEGDFEQSYVPHFCGEICRQYLMRADRAGRLDEPFDLVGRSWYDDPSTRANGELDVVTSGPSGYAFYEAKFQGTPVSEPTIRKEVAQVRATGLGCHTYGFISRSGFEPVTMGGVELIGIDELYR